MEFKNEYYTISANHDLNIIGQYPQAVFHKNYNPNTPNGMWNVTRNKLPDFIPHLEVSLHKKAKRTDFIDLSGLEGGLIVSHKLKNILSEYSLPKHDFYSITVHHKQDKLEYFWFFYEINDFWEHLDNDKSYAEIVNADNIGKIEGKIPIISQDQLYLEEDKYKFPYNVRTGKIVLKDSIPKYDFYQICCLGYQKVLSRNLVKHLIDSNIKGFEFTPISYFEIL